MKKQHLKIFLIFFLISSAAFSQEADNSAILKVIFSKYYKDEKVIAKGRLQLLSFYCKKAPNNEEVLEVISKSEFLKKNAAEIKKQIVMLDEDWSAAYNILFDNQNQYLKSKVNNCLSLEEFQAANANHGENNQRLMIISKPIYFGNGNHALVKVAFYRSIEHNSGSYLLLEKINDVWTIKEYLNQWAT